MHYISHYYLVDKDGDLRISLGNATNSGAAFDRYAIPKGWKYINRSMRLAAVHAQYPGKTFYTRSEHAWLDQPAVRPVADLLKTRLFIENDPTMLEVDKQAVSRLFDRPFETVFDTYLFDAASQPREVWKAIQEHSHIFACTHFIGDSARLFNHLMEKALELRERLTPRGIYILSRLEDVRMRELDAQMLHDMVGYHQLYFLDTERTQFNLWLPQ